MKNEEKEYLIRRLEKLPDKELVISGKIDPITFESLINESPNNLDKEVIKEYLLELGRKEVITYLQVDLNTPARAHVAI